MQPTQTAAELAIGETLHTVSTAPQSLALQTPGEDYPTKLYRIYTE